ncbi:MAG: hypothetical protein KAU41_06570 [Deltaproteobacteria bacterium]|nr:hypothetical protein [Deltaproteobacteria bacterium]
MIPLKKPEMQGGEISSKLKAQSSKSYRNQPLSAFSFRLSALKQRRRLGFFSGTIDDTCMDDIRGYIALHLIGRYRFIEL